MRVAVVRCLIAQAVGTKKNKQGGGTSPPLGLQEEQEEGKGEGW